MRNFSEYLYISWSKNISWSQLFWKPNFFHFGIFRDFGNSCFSYFGICSSFSGFQNLFVIQYLLILLVFLWIPKASVFCRLWILKLNFRVCLIFLKCRFFWNFWNFLLLIRMLKIFKYVSGFLNTVQSCHKG